MIEHIAPQQGGQPQQSSLLTSGRQQIASTCKLCRTALRCLNTMPLALATPAATAAQRQAFRGTAVQVGRIFVRSAGLRNGGIAPKPQCASALH